MGFLDDAKKAALTAGNYLSLINVGIDTIKKLLGSVRRNVEEEVEEAGEAKKAGLKLRRKKENEEWTSLRGKERWKFLKNRHRKRDT